MSPATVSRSVAESNGFCRTIPAPKARRHVGEEQIDASRALRGEAHGSRAVFGDQDVVSVRGQDVPGQPTHALVVLDEQHSFMSPHPGLSHLVYPHPPASGQGPQS